jgi:hypothetical protein
MKPWQFVVPASLLLAGAVHLLPAVGVVGHETLRSLYGISLNDPNVALLMRHRAVLFGIVGLLLAAAAFYTSLRPAAFLAGMMSVASFLGLAAVENDLSSELQTVFVVDLIVFACLACGAIFAVARRHGKPTHGSCGGARY